MFRDDGRPNEHRSFRPNQNPSGRGGDKFPQRLHGHSRRVGKWAEIDDEKAAISALVFETQTPGFEVIRTEDKMGHRGSSTAAIAHDGSCCSRLYLLWPRGRSSHA